MADNLRRVNPAIKVVYYSGYVTAEQMVARLGVEEAVFLDKAKGNPQDIVAAVRHELDRVRSEPPQPGAGVDPTVLFGSVTHALGNKLGLARALLRERAPSPDTELIYSLVRDAVDVLHRATTQLAVMALERRPTRLPSISADEILQRAVESCRSLYSSATISLNLPAEPILIQAVPVLLESALFDLIVNGIQAASPDPRTVAVGLERVERERPYARITVADNGKGIPREVIPTLFLPGYSTKKGKGLGMGLFFAAKVAQYHSGWIEVESRAAVGTEVRLYVGVTQDRDLSSASPPSG